MTTSLATERDTPICEVAGVRKRYGGVEALAGVDLRVYPGTVHAILGENGAGKSTLMKILSGAEQPDEGEVRLRGEPVSFGSVAEANRQGVAIVFQELSLFPDLELFANLFIRNEPRRFGVVQRAQMRRRAEPVLREIGLDADVTTAVANLRLDQRQLVEIAKALLQESAVLILDEPNSALNAEESERLFAVVRKLRERGVAVLYISHRLEEVFQIADAITVMRNGQVVRTTTPSETTMRKVVVDMIGREPEPPGARTQRTIDRKSTPLRVQGLTVKGRLKEIDVEAYPGEIVGVAGLQGSGAEVLLQTLFGVQTIESGSVTLPDGRPGPRSIPDAVRKRIAYIPPDRRTLGLMLEQSVLTNMSQVTAGALGEYGTLLRRPVLSQRARDRSASLQIKARSLDMYVNQLSGGNQQKVVLGKWLEADPGLVLMDDPTRGVDVGAKAEIYEITTELAGRGRIVLFTSSELPEYVLLCDRVLIMYGGSVRGELSGDSLTEHNLLEVINTGVMVDDQIAR